MTMQLQLAAGNATPAEGTGTMGIRTTVLFGALVAVAFLGGFGTWAALAPLDAAAIAPGVVLVEGKRKTIQHLEGGIVGTILVEEGTEVVQGEHLVWLDDTQPRARLDVLRTQMTAASALAARLEAERDGAEVIAFPASLTASDEAGAQQAIAGQQRIFEVRQRSLANQVAVLKKRIAQLQEEITGLKLEIRAQDRQLDLIKEEADAVEKLVADGLARKPRLLALQREHADIMGRRGKNVAAVARAGQAIGETELRIEELTTGRIREIVEELRDVQTEIQDLRERLAAARDVLRRTIIKAPVDGTVVSLQVFTSGGVISPGEPIMDIVPGEPALIVEARVNPDDIDSVEVGLPAQIRFPAFSQRAAPVFDGTVAHVSADRMDDERTGEAFYFATVRLDAEQPSAAGDYQIQVGMSAEVMIVTGARTMVEYLVSPIRDSLSRAMTEQ